MIKYIGDISKADAELLRYMAEDFDNILEFGCGASTQVIAKYLKEDSAFLSIDTSIDWIDKTVENFDLLGIGIRDKVDLVPYEHFFNVLLKSEEEKFDFVFNDGADNLRREFAIKIWPHIKVGGCIGFHDTRRGHDFRNVLEVLAQFQNEICDVEFNARSSNITLVFKKEAEPYDNWQISENRQPFELGYGPIPEDYKKLMWKSE